ncbi:hypothetical protein JCM14719A_22250 [Calditerricola satsumensis]|uniref:Uncharacterized protein n=1 Tax=Calditerricola satsumensis TaxID=373054 RepID=A0A8J3BCS5_9BACI|nr:hypothetical protein GCM10007043_18280 [Calditerricola satsumensis]
MRTREPAGGIALQERMEGEEFERPLRYNEGGTTEEGAPLETPKCPVCGFALVWRFGKWTCTNCGQWTGC